MLTMYTVCGAAKSDLLTLQPSNEETHQKIGQNNFHLHKQRRQNVQSYFFFFHCRLDALLYLQKSETLVQDCHYL